METVRLTTAAEAGDFPFRLFDTTMHRIHRPGPDAKEVASGAAVIGAADKPLLIAEGGVHYSGAGEELTAFAEGHTL